MKPEPASSRALGASKRITVGVILDDHFYTGTFPNMFASAVVEGIRAAAQDQGINILVACGINRADRTGRVYPAWPEPGPEVHFIPVGPWNTDGLLVFSPLRMAERIRYIRELQERRFPLLFIGGGSGHPTIMVDNEGGIRQALEHLVSHGHRSIAFVAGDETDPGDSLLRLNAYRQGVRELGLNEDPRLVVYGQHWDVDAEKAVAAMLETGVRFSAVMCSNDQSALGAYRALRAAGLHIPGDVAVTGFDDVLGGLAQIPPLTSVHFPLFETGYRSLLLMRRRIDAGPDALPEEVRVTTHLMPRQSCGCMPDLVMQAAAANSRGPSWNPSTGGSFRQELVQRMLDDLLRESTTIGSRDIRPLCNRLVDAFLLSLEDGDLSHFQIALVEILQRVESNIDGDGHIWQMAVSTLHSAVRADVLGGTPTRRLDRAEDMLHQARILLCESAQRRYTRFQVEQTQRSEAMGRLTSRLLSTSEKSQVFAVLREELLSIGIQNCVLAYFESREGDPVGLCRLQTLVENATEIVSETRAFPPPGLFSDDKPFQLSLLPLIYQEVDLGFLAFESVSLEPLAIVALQLSGALTGVELHAQVLELSLTDGLTEVHNRRYFELMLEKETDRSQRYNRDLSVIMADIDHFKLYNDAFGHPEGDRALKEVAQCITRGARRGLDVVTRYGGEEFAVILPETDAEGARKVAEKIRGEMAASGKFRRQTTVSLGVASLRGSELRGRQLVEEADRALYQAKNQGRDRVVVFEDWMQESAHQTERKS